jgi:hypothetical protein
MQTSVYSSSWTHHANSCCPEPSQSQTENYNGNNRGPISKPAFEHSVSSFIANTFAEGCRNFCKCSNIGGSLAVFAVDLQQHLDHDVEAPHAVVPK